MKYLKKFEKTADYEEYMAGIPDFPNVSYIVESGATFFENDSPLYIEAVNNLTFQFTKALKYSLDNETWVWLPADTSSPTISKGEKVYLRANLKPSPSYSGPNASKGIGTFTISGYCNVGGNIMSLLFGANYYGEVSLAGYNYAFKDLFRSCYNILNAAELKLPATTLADYCYYRTFMHCDNLVSAPPLPATSLASHCYDSMFWGCYDLPTAPELPASVLADECYRDMYYSCVRLQYIKMLATDISASDCLYHWVGGITSSGTFVKAAGVTIPTGESGIPSGWTVEEVEV